MVSKAFSFRLPDAAVQAIESLQLDGETLNQALQRFVLEQLGLSTQTSKSLSTMLYTGADIEELIDKRIEASLGTRLDELRSQLEAQLEELRGKLKAR
jgi:ABC-type proline/glycine betaine transport system substrate-binding protein